jgi:hypothetical protein
VRKKELLFLKKRSKKTFAPLRAALAGQSQTNRGEKLRLGGGRADSQINHDQFARQIAEFNSLLTACGVKMKSRFQSFG